MNWFKKRQLRKEYKKLGSWYLVAKQRYKRNKGEDNE